MFLIKDPISVYYLSSIFGKERKLGQRMFGDKTREKRPLPSPSPGYFPAEGRAGTSLVLLIFPAFYPRPAEPLLDREPWLH